MTKQFESVDDHPVTAFLYTTKLITDEFAPLAKRGEFVLLDTKAKAKEGDLVAIRQTGYPGYFLEYFTKGVKYFAVGAGVGRRLNKNEILTSSPIGENNKVTPSQRAGAMAF